MSQPTSASTGGGADGGNGGLNHGLNGADASGSQPFHKTGFHGFLFFSLQKAPCAAQGACGYTVPQISFSKFPSLSHSLITHRVASSSSAGFPSSSK
ncbi:MAG: hypothetical protein ACLUN6_03760 [Holdemanella sp.]